jgi:hypothetical protein
MKTGASLALICIGAILAFAVTGNTSFFNIHTAGWVLMLIGVIGLVLPKRNAGWLGRRMLVRRSFPSGQVEHIPVPPYVARNPGTAALEAGLPSRPTLLDQEDDLIERTEAGYDQIQESEIPMGHRRTGQQEGGQQWTGQQGTVEPGTVQPGTVQPGTGSGPPSPPAATEVIEDLYEQP